MHPWLTTGKSSNIRKICDHYDRVRMPTTSLACQRVCSLSCSTHDFRLWLRFHWQCYEKWNPPPLNQCSNMQIAISLTFERLKRCLLWMIQSNVRPSRLPPQLATNKPLSNRIASSSEERLSLADVRWRTAFWGERSRRRQHTRQLARPGPYLCASEWGLPNRNAFCVPQRSLAIKSIPPLSRSLLLING